MSTELQERISTLISQGIITQEIIDQLIANNVPGIIEESARSVKWCAVIFHSDRLIARDNQAIFNPINRRRMPVNQIFQYVSDSEKGYLDSVTLHPGTNIGKHTRQETASNLIERLPDYVLDIISKNPVNSFYFSEGIIEKIYPDNPDDIGEPGYRHFSIADAIKLISYHTAIDWIDRALVAEIRPEVITFATQQKKRIVDALRRDNS